MGSRAFIRSVEPLFVQIDHDRRSGRMTLSLGRNDDEAVGAGRRREDGRAAQCERLDLAFGQANPAVVDASDRGNDLARDASLARAMRPVATPPAAQPDRAPGEEIICAKARNGISWKQ